MTKTSSAAVAPSDDKPKPRAVPSKSYSLPAKNAIYLICLLVLYKISPSQTFNWQESLFAVSTYLFTAGHAQMESALVDCARWNTVADSFEVKALCIYQSFALVAGTVAAGGIGSQVNISDRIDQFNKARHARS